MADKTLVVQLTRSEIGYFAHCSCLSQCQGLGETPEEAMDAFLSDLERYARSLPAAQCAELLACRVSPCERG